MAIKKHIAGGTGFQVEIWAETANINFFLKTPLTPASESGVVTKQASVAAHTRRQYPGDPTPANVAANQREFMYDPGARNGSALPGKNFWLVKGIGTAGEERRQFTYVGKLRDLHAFIVGDAKYDLTLYGPTGKRYEIAEADTTP